MKNILFLSLIILLLYGCSNDESSKGEKPVFVLNTETSQLLPVPGENMYLRGTAQSSSFIKSLRIIVDSWELDKTIQMKNGVQTYELDYKFPAPEDTTGKEETPICVVVTDVNNQTAQYVFYASATGDKTSPEIFENKNIRLYLKSEYEYVPGNFNFMFDVVDDNLLKDINIECKELDYSKTISVDAKDFHFENSFILTEGNIYNIVITATDKNGNIAEKNVTLLGLKDYDRMFFADVDTELELNSDLYGIPMEAIKEERYCFYSLYYNREPNTEVRFLTSKETFKDNTFGCDENGNLVLGHNRDVPPIILPKVNQYYKVAINVKNNKVTIEEVSPGIDPYSRKEYGVLRGSSGWIDSPIWAPKNFNKMNRYSETNSYLRFVDLTVNSKHNSLDFVITGAAWNPLFQFLATDRPDVIVKGSNINAKFPYSILQDTEYRFYLDTYTNRSWAVPLK